MLVENVFVEAGVSGAAESREQLAKMMVSLEQNHHGVTTVVIERLDRLARDLMVQEAIIRDLKGRGFELVSVHEGSDLLSGDPTRKLIRQVLGAIAEYDKEMTVVKLRVARERKRARDGRCEGPKPIEEENPELLKEIIRLRRKPKLGKRMTYGEIAEHLNDQGIIPRMADKWTEHNVRMTLYNLGKRKAKTRPS
jgi:DNA invertase Pin-like site-specific DNA recombinase